MGSSAFQNCSLPPNSRQAPNYGTGDAFPHDSPYDAAMALDMGNACLYLSTIASLYACSDPLFFTALQEEVNSATPRKTTDSDTHSFEHLARKRLHHSTIRSSLSQQREVHHKRSHKQPHFPPRRPAASGRSAPAVC